ncbi:MAG: hypothetical protein P8Y69_17280 [Gammaproteobacteria bacterium]
MRAKIATVTGLVVCSMCMWGANTALAGEVNGKGEPIPGGHTGKSACSFSGQQDDPVADDGFFRGDRVQSWGQIPKNDEDSELWIGRALLTMMGMHPGEACNPTRAEEEPI